MEEEDDISAAVDLIAQRVQDAESQFIKKNAADKQKIENVIDRLSNRLSAVKKADEQNSPEDSIDANPDMDNNSTDELGEEEQLESTRLITAIREDGYKSVFETIVRDNMEYILKNPILKEEYSIDGKLDMNLIMESSKVIYGFIEFVNTIQLEHVNEDFILDVLEG